MEWISIIERTPNSKMSFLGTDGEIIFAAYWCEDSDSYKVGGWESCCYCGGASAVGFSVHLYKKLVTHWMPLPQPPKE